MDKVRDAAAVGTPQRPLQAARQHRSLTLKPPGLPETLALSYQLLFTYCQWSPWPLRTKGSSAQPWPFLRCTLSRLSWDVL